MEPFRVLEHTADVGFEACGRSLEETFSNAAKALQGLIADSETVEPREAINLEVEGHDLASLLVNWLSEILYRFDAEGWLFRSFRFLSFDPTRLRVEALGERFDRERHQIAMLVKAITYHQLSLEQTAWGWRARVYVDI